MAKKNGKWVVGIIFALVAALAFFSVRLKNDIMRRAAEAESAEQAAE